MEEGVRGKKKKNFFFLEPKTIIQNITYKSVASIPMASGFKYINKLQNHHVLILGGSTGVGFCVAEAALEYGASVVVSSSNKKKLDVAIRRLQGHIRATGLPPERLSAWTCDLSNPDTIEDDIIQLLEFATKDGKLDHVVLTAGDLVYPKNWRDMSVVEIHAMFMVRQVGSIMLAKHLPNYVNAGITSSFTLTGGTRTWRPTPNSAVIAGCGGSIEALTRGFAIDLRPIRVNCVRLGSVLTESWNLIIPGDKLPDMVELYAKEGITGVIGKPEEVAEAYIYLMKDTFATGSVVDSNGGRLVGDSRDRMEFH